MDAFREVVLARDGTTCQCCGTDVLYKLASIQHRIPRGAGGSARVNRPSNGVLVCGSATTPGSCHNWMEHEDRTAAEDLGWLLPKLNADIDPATEPIYTQPYGWVLLDDEGNRTPCAPPLRVIA
jgi:hypothetical protein